MEDNRAAFLEKMTEILGRLHDTCIERGEPLLGSVLAIAKGEAEDALRHANELNALIALRDKMTSATSWRPMAPAAEHPSQEEIAA
jgi:hypothetical protein